MDSNMKTKKEIFIGGLFRCCLATLETYQKFGYAEAENATLTCAYCHKETMVVKDGVWQWNRKN